MNYRITQFLGKFLQQIYAKSTAALIERSVPMGLSHINVAHIVIGRNSTKNTTIH